MKRISKAAVILALLFAQFTSLAQENGSGTTSKSIEPYHIAIGYNKTSNLIFPYPIRSVDRGSASVLAQKARGANNILQLKADKENFPQTNISVVTADAKFYSFIVDYTSDPSPLNISFTYDSSGNNQNLLLSESAVNEATFDTIAKRILSEKSFLHNNVKEQKMRFLLRSIYIKENIMWFAFTLCNKSLIDYNVDYVRFFIRDRKRTKRTAVQENELQPLYCNGSKKIKGKLSGKIIYAFQPFTIPKTKELTIRIGEQNGGRALIMPVGYKTILKTKLLQ